MKGAERFIRAYEAGELIFQEGDIGKEMFVVVAGNVEIYRQSADGSSHTLANLGPGEMFGEMALVSEGRRSATACAKSEAVKLVHIDQARFVYLVSQQPAFALSVIRMMAERLAGQNKSSIAASVMEVV